MPDEITRQNTYRNYLLTILMVALAFSYVDRMIFGLAQQYIKIDLQLTDTQLGMLNGAVFALFFSVMGMPIARWADRGDRVLILALTTAVWGVTVSLCGFAGGFVQLLLIRSGTAAGEAGCSPPANSLIPEYFERTERARAGARYMLGVSLGPAIGYFVGGWMLQGYGWRTTFILVGLPGLVLATLAVVTLREPRRTGCSAHDPSSSAAQLSRGATVQPGLRDVATLLWKNRTFRHLLFCYLIWYFCGWAIVQWQATFFLRSHGVGSGELGTWLAVSYGIGGLLGTWCGGEWGARHAARNESLQLMACALSFVAYAALIVGVLVLRNYYWALGLLGVSVFVSAAAYGPLFATSQTLIPPHVRATAQSLINLVPSFIGMGLGPLTAGALSDALHPWFGDESLRYALLLICPGYCWAAWHLWCASRTVAQDLAGEDNATATVGSETNVRSYARRADASTGP